MPPDPLTPISKDTTVSEAAAVPLISTEPQVPTTSAEFQVPSTEEGGASTPAPLVGVVSEQVIVQPTPVIEPEKAGLTTGQDSTKYQVPSEDGLADSAGSVVPPEAVEAAQADVVLPPVMETTKDSPKYQVPSAEGDSNTQPTTNNLQQITGDPSSRAELTTGQGGAGTPAPASTQGFGEAQPVLANASNGGIEAFSLIGGLLAKARVALQARKRKKLDRIMSQISLTGTITNERVCKLLRVSRATAFRYLDALEKEGKIRQTGKTGRGVEYQSTNNK